MLDMMNASRKDHVTSNEGYWPSPWPGEDNGADRNAVSSLQVTRDLTIRMTSRLAPIATMVVLRAPGEVFLLCHSGGDEAKSWVERIDPETLEPLARSVDLAAGPTWPGGLAAHVNGSLYVVFGSYVHRLSSGLELLGSRELPRTRPYNSFVLLNGGEIVTKDFGGSRPGESSDNQSHDCEVLVLDPDTLETLGSCTLPEASVARVSASHNEIYVVGVTRLFRLWWREGVLILDEDFIVPYRSDEGEGYGWDAVVTDSHVWFLDNGAGSEAYAGSLVGLGTSRTGQKLLQVDRASGAIRRFSVHDQSPSIVANPPAIDARRSIAVGYDSSNGVVRAFDFSGGNDEVLWTRKVNHAMHPVILADSRLVMLDDYDVAEQRDDVVFLDLFSGEEMHRARTESPLQSVLFASQGFGEDVYVCSFSHVSRISFSSD